jgi:hypothetical protein
MVRKLTLISIFMFVFIISTSVWAIDVKKDAALVGLWLFDDGSGTVVKDSSGNGNDGKITGTFKWETGKFGGALIAAGTGQIDVPKSASLDKVTKAMTIAAWYRIDAASDTGLRRPNAYLIEDQSTTEPVPDSFSFRIWTSKGLSPGIYGKTKLQQKTWYHLAGTYDGTQMLLYINGVAESVVTDSTGAAIDGKWSGDIGIPTDALQLKLGSETLVGGMDEIILFSRALTAKEIKELMVGAINPTAVSNYEKLTTKWAAIKR